MDPTRKSIHPFLFRTFLTQSIPSQRSKKTNEPRGIIHSTQSIFLEYRAKHDNHTDVIVFAACHLLAQKQAKSSFLDVWSILHITKATLLQMEQVIFEVMLKAPFDMYPFDTLIGTCKRHHFPSNTIEDALLYFDDSLVGTTNNAYAHRTQYFTPEAFLLLDRIFDNATRRTIASRLVSHVYRPQYKHSSDVHDGHDHRKCGSTKEKLILSSCKSFAESGYTP